MQNERKFKQHKFLDKHTWLGVLLLMFGSFALMQLVIGMGLGVAFRALTGGDFTACVAYGASIYGLFLIRKAKRPEIIALWDKKWNRGGTEER